MPTDDQLLYQAMQQNGELPKGTPAPPAQPTPAPASPNDDDLLRQAMIAHGELPSSFSVPAPVHFLSMGSAPRPAAIQPPPLPSVTGQALTAAIQQSDRTLQAFQQTPNAQTAAAHKAALINAVPLVAQSGLLSLPDWQTWAAKVKSEGWLNPAQAPAPNVSAPTPPVSQGWLADTFGTGDHEGSIHKDLSGYISGAIPLLKQAGTAYIQGAAAQGLGNAAMMNPDMAPTAASMGLKSGVTAAPLINGMTGTLQDIAAGRAAQIPGNYLKEAKEHPLKFGLNTLAMVGGGAGLLGKAGDLATLAGAAKVGAGLTKAGEIAQSAATLGPLGKAVSRGIETGAQKVTGTIKAPAMPPAETLQTGAKTAVKQVVGNATDTTSVSPDNAPPIELHPTSPIGPNGTARAVDGTFVSPEAAAPAEAPAEAPAPNVPASSVPAKPKPPMAGNINLGRIETTPEAAATIPGVMENVNGNPTTHAQIQAAARKLNLTPADLEPITPGTVPGNVTAPVFTTAVRELHVAQAEKSVAAEAAYKASPTPENLNALTTAAQNQKLAATHASALAESAGQTLGAHNIQANAFEGAMNAAQERAQALTSAPTLDSLRPQTTFNTAKIPGVRAAPKPRPPRADPNVTDADLQAAIANIKNIKVNTKLDSSALSSGGVGAVSPVVESLSDAGSELFKNAVVIGHYYLERGAMKFGDWAAKIRPHFPGASDGQLQHVYAQARADHAEQITKTQRSLVQPVFVEHFGKVMGRANAANLANDLPPGALDKMISGAPMTDAERQGASAAYFKNLGAKTPPSAPTDPAIRAMKEILAETRKPAMQARRKALAAARRAAKATATRAAGGTARQRGAATPPDPLIQTIGRRVGGIKNAPAFLSRIGPDLENKLRTGASFTDPETRTLAGHLDAMKPVKNAPNPSDVSLLLTKAVRDAKAGRLGHASAKEAVREELLKAVPPEKVPAVAKALAGVGDNDFHALANVYNRYHPATAADKFKTVQQASLLSGPKTLGAITAAHTIGAGFEDLAVRPVASLLSRGSIQGLSPKSTLAAVRAGVHAIPEGGQIIKEGPTAMQLRGISPRFRTDEIPGGHLHGEPVQSPIVRAPGRVHAALYHIIGEALQERGIQEFSALKAKQHGGNASQYRADPDVVQKANQYRTEQLFQNKNAAASAITKAGQGHEGIKVTANTLLPFRNVPLNLAGRGLEYSGLGAPVAGARALKAKLTGNELFSGNPIVPKGASAADALAAKEAFRRSVAFQAARGIVGPALGGGLGYGLTASGVLNPPNEQKFENGSINAGKYKYDISRLQPVSTPILEGGELYNALHGKPANPLAPFADNPYSQVAETLDSVKSGFSGKPGALKGIIRTTGGFVGEFSPTLLAQIASATDPSGNVRQKKAAWDYLFNRVPGLREKLLVGKYTQASNIKSVGVLRALMSPVNVSPRNSR